jgi:16S rRNA (guanine527-N7)-methyltransferase
VTIAARERIAERSAHHGLAVDGAVLDRFATYAALLARWNRTINLTALPLEGMPDHTVDRLFLEPMAAAAHVPPRPIEWLDFGSGGGSPAIPLKILCPTARLTMVESRSRKAAFLREVIRELDLSDAEALLARVHELVTLRPPHLADLITARGIRLDDGTSLVAGVLLKPDGRLLRFVGPSDDTATEVTGFERLEDVDLPTPGARLQLWRPAQTRSET